MRFNKYTIKTLTGAEDIISSTLMDMGVEGVQIEDKQPLTEQDKEAMFVDILPQAEEDDGIAYVSFYLDSENDNEELINNIKNEIEELKSFMDLGECSFVYEQLQDTDYLNNWKQYFHQFYIDDILVIPSWEEVDPEDKDKMIIHIDPGTAFGTGMHETTQLCIRQLRKYINDKSVVLDVGTGSGILSIMSYKFGAKEAVGTDLDPCAIEAVQDNMENNGLSEAGFKLIIGNIIDSDEIRDEVGYEKYDIVVANILAEVLVPLTPVIYKHLKSGGIYITSGIIEDKENVVKEAVEAAGFSVISVEHQGEWVSVTAKKP
ncbi:MAG: 50S ribosomal protein L11 methyltransferase [Lachnospiraceae bacterium]|nr:50S ribosomal protein L11 methyltransferase [Lachnospiraceae bacterium]